jgi:mono/diheme cytochrome c family protein
MTFKRMMMASAGACLSAVAMMLAGCGQAEKPLDPAAKAARGQYLVEKVGMCADCHSPRGPGGVFDRGHWLQGAPLGFAPTVPMPAWAAQAPAIAGLANYTDEQAVALLTAGQTIHGQPLRPPMPEYRFTTNDAEAIVAYLRSLR